MNELLPMITERDGIPVTTRLTLWSMLEQIGTIEARERDSAPMVASFKECKAGAIYIKNEKLERR